MNIKNEFEYKKLSEKSKYELNKAQNEFNKIMLENQKSTGKTFFYDKETWEQTLEMYNILMLKALKNSNYPEYIKASIIRDSSLAVGHYMGLLYALVNILARIGEEPDNFAYSDIQFNSFDELIEYVDKLEISFWKVYQNKENYDKYILAHIEIANYYVNSIEDGIKQAKEILKNKFYSNEYLKTCKQYLDYYNENITPEHWFKGDTKKLIDIQTGSQLKYMDLSYTEWHTYLASFAMFSAALITYQQSFVLGDSTLLTCDALFRFFAQSLLDNYKKTGHFF